MGDDILLNRKASHDFRILETFEAGIVLKGTEVKSLRDKRGNLAEASARIENEEAWLFGCDIQPYAPASRFNHEPKAKRRLLLHRAEIRKLSGLASIRGRRLVPLKMYWKNGHVKVLIGVGEVKTKVDKRQDLRKKAAQSEMAQETKRTRRHRGI